MRLPRHVLAPNVPAIARSELAIYRLAVHLGQQDVGNCLQHITRRAFEQIGNPYQQASFTQTDSVVYIGETEELDLKLRDRRPRPKLAKSLFKNLDEFAGHGNKSRLARSSASKGCPEKFPGRPEAHSPRALSLWSCFFLCLKSSSCSASRSRWSLADSSIASSALPSKNA